ncbi:DUF1553 domain-containing protein [Tuwongella immobilis]|uniref:BIG2 domain-containing protein n=1 Tax=Tuwongella immobilis TaxID=692036 RepID=A0A6C2YWH4_9BACT|nr:DUF1553 domain-containing protein [Tuwongella immobilis]VIP05717.1 Ig-like domain-containing protein OS=Singulisphaera acidiphila (strain ATCC BAA-1392 / DSM 18658 / VKM B-2454 / MOB10) GN=Sinac_3078 PE=4 SV=1: Big_2: PSCyt2: PSD1 [Tuwongella immobilis]VTS08790.1 Ig-like domain-containing protein OS=Singulisphaera acidiphila (strain ATCC BAA-1392 / DSM 18658 / VKM B-2454 / MOB10) GN=Sinac_3078 PE=4 SV=1: Big_2: PSCyt2: PSD1 [Tuwongella immobilis]
MLRRLILSCLIGTIWSLGVHHPVLAAAPTPAATPEIQDVTVFPSELRLRGIENSPQLLITGKRADGRLIDLTATAQYTVTDPQLLRVTTTGRVTPLKNGQTSISIQAAGKQLQLPVNLTAMDESLPINFPNQVVPIFSKLSCNSGGCHGKLSGQNGFRLSLLGFDPELDYMTLVKESRGRRLIPTAPDHSLFLLKGTGKVAHGGGRKMEPDSDEYKIVRRWIAAGMPYGSPEDPTIVKISVTPDRRVLDRQISQQLVVTAHYSDGSTLDVTRQAQYESNDLDIATVNDTGSVQTLSMSGEAAIMARFQGQVAVFRATIPLGKPVPSISFPVQTVVDTHTQTKWRELGLVPSDLCSDEQFIRRVTLDLTGTLPTPQQIRDFVADAAADKRSKLVDRLLETPEYSFYFANKWADILRVKRRQQPDRAFGTFAFHGWIRDAIARDVPYDQFARSILSAVGDESKYPPAVWYKEIQTAEQFVDDLSQVFLGQRLACANCHHHPYEKWSQDDYWGLAAFYGRLGRKTVTLPGVTPQNQRNQRQLLFVRSNGTVTNKRTGKAAAFKPLDGDELTIAEDTDPRLALADWMVDAKNPFFAKTVANRYWAHFLGRGIVDPLDDMRITNPPSNPELLDALAADLVKNRYSLKSLIRTIVNSRTYQLSSTPNDFNARDKQAYSRYYPKRLSAEVLFDAVCQVTDSPSNFSGLPNDRFAPNRAIMLPDESFTSYFLDVFGRPQRISACECERVNEANLAQSLHLLNSDEVQSKLSRGDGRADRLAKDKSKSDDEKIDELFLWVVGHKPSAKQKQMALEHLQQNPKDPKQAYENMIWALINSKAFLFNY